MAPIEIVGVAGVTVIELRVGVLPPPPPDAPPQPAITTLRINARHASKPERIFTRLPPRHIGRLFLRLQRYLGTAYTRRRAMIWVLMRVSATSHLPGMQRASPVLLVHPISFRTTRARELSTLRNTEQLRKNTQTPGFVIPHSRGAALKPRRVIPFAEASI